MLPLPHVLALSGLEVAIRLFILISRRILSHNWVVLWDGKVRP